ncbi:hypothetical protein KXR53_14390 [Inquilinus limosus]|uniref:hypothetical protein n=1 Tax=Inquilinus limosus TaxID=171674 RepID=UPI003F15A99A
MVDTATSAETSAAEPATGPDARDVAALDEMRDLALGLARAFQAQGVAALQAGDLDRAANAEAGFSRLFLGIRRAVALKAKLREQREETLRAAEDRRNRRQEEKDDRRQAVAQRVSRAIATEKPEAQERLTTELWTRLVEDERIDADLADTVLPLETLILRLGRDIGLSRRALAAGLDPDRAKADRAGPQGAAGGSAAGPTAWVFPPPPGPPEPSAAGRYRCIPAADLGLPGDEAYLVNIDTGEVFDDDDNVVMRLPPEPPPGRPAAAEPGDTGPPAAASPPDPGPPNPEDRGRRQAGGEWTAMQIIARSLGRYG